MEKFESAVHTFLKGYEGNKEVIGAVICGSYITGNPSPQSDIDLHIILDDSAARRERGNVYIDGFLIEYFINPIRQHYIYAEEDYAKRRIVNVHMLTTGKIVFDTDNKIKKLISELQPYLDKKYNNLAAPRIELLKYSIWDMNDNLSEIYNKSGTEFSFVYFSFLKDIFEIYSSFLQYRKIETHKIFRLLTSSLDRKKYNIESHCDSHFVNLFVRAVSIHDRDMQMSEFNTLTVYVLEKMGGFNIDGWSLKTDCA